MGHLAAEQRADAGHELVKGERFDQVVVGAAVKSAHAIRDRVAGSQHQDRDAHAAPPQLATDLETVAFGQHHVEDHHVVGRHFAEQLAVLAIVGNVHSVARLHQRMAEGLLQPAVVFNEEQSHVPPLWRRHMTPR